MATYTTNLNLEKPAPTDYVDIAVFNENADKIDTAVAGKANKPTILTASLTAGSTSLNFNNAAIKTDSTIDVYVSVYGVSPTAMVVSNGNAALTFEAQGSTIQVKLEVR